MATESISETVASTLDIDDEDPRIAAALCRIESGTFGLCLTCDRSIDRALIDADPLAERCGPCERAAARTLSFPDA